METTDIWFAAFLKHRGFAIIDYYVLGKGRGKYKFDISSEEYKKQKMLFINSEISKIKQNMEEIKDLLY